jgi:NhaP-type Na+/H+ or K+/H+ antiporter
LTEHLLIAIASIITLGIAAEWFAWRIGLPSILVLLVFGFVAGPVSGFLDPGAMLGDLLFPIVSISVAVILFEGGASLRIRELRQIGRVVRNLVTLGAALTWALAALAAYYFLGLDRASAALLGAILVVTGPTVIVPLLRHMRPVPQVASTLKWEGILIDPIGAVLAVLVFEAVLAGELGTATTAVSLIVLKTLLVGGFIAALGVGVLILLMDRQWVPDFLQSPLALMVVIAAFAVSNVIQAESGLLTATVMGVALANQKAVGVKHILEFKENLRVLLISSLFILLAARLDLGDLRQIGVPELGFLAVLVLAIRPLSVAASTLGSELGWRERVMVAFVAPRGIVAAAVSAIFALELAGAGYTDAQRLVSLTFLVIIGTVAIYGLGSSPLARWLGVAKPDPQGVLFVGAHPWARQIAAELAEGGFAVRLVDTNYTNIADARMEGLPAYYGSALTEAALDAIDLDGIGRVLALTANDEVNSLTAVNFIEVFGQGGVYQIPPEQLSAGSQQLVSRHLRGRFLFDQRASYWSLTARFDADAMVKTTNLTEEFDFEKFKDRYPEAIPLFLIGGNGKLAVFTIDDPPEPGPGTRILAVVNRRDDANKTPRDGIVSE